VWAVLGACGHNMILEAEQSLGDVSRHVDVACTGSAVPVEGEATVLGARQVSGDSVEFAEGLEKMVYVGGVDILDAKVVNGEAERDGSVGMCEEAGGVTSNGMIAMGGKVLDKACVGNNPGLWQPVHALADFDHNVAIMDKGEQIVLCHDGGRNVTNGNTHVVKSRHWIIKVKIGDVGGQKFGLGRGEHTVQQEFDGGEVGCGGADFTREFNLVTAYRESQAFGFGFEWAEFSNNAQVGYSSVGGDVGVPDEMYGVGATGHVW